MRVISHLFEIREWAGDREASRSRVLVPTMGALHEGHLSLVDIAREKAGEEGEVVATIFVNPTQFAPHEDFDSYPRELESDLDKLEARGTDIVLVPERDAIYAADDSTAVIESVISRGLEGVSRPQFFGGVCTVVAKLFNLSQPDAAVFGEKDYQQLAVIRRMVRDLLFPVEILAGPTIREADGLAMSSRNVYLDPEERRQAVSLSHALNQARTSIEAGVLDGPSLLAGIRGKIGEQPLAKIDYVAMVDPDTLEPIETAEGDALIAVAVFFGKTRLIDNLCWRPGIRASGT